MRTSKVKASVTPVAPKTPSRSEPGRFELNTIIAGKPTMEYMADLLERNEEQEIDIERGKLAVGILKQMNNRSKLLLDAQKFELKEIEAKKTKA